MENNLKNNHKTIFLKDYTPPDFLVESADLQFTLDPKNTIVTARLLIKKNPQINSTTITLDGCKLKLQAIKLNKRELSNTEYNITSETLTIFQVPDEFILETTVTIHPDQNFTCTGLYLTDDNFCTQNEPHGFRYITYFIDRPDVLTKFTTTIIADKTNYPVLLANGNLIAANELTNNQHTVTWQDPFPKSSYLFALVAGKFGHLTDYYTTTTKRKITLRIFAQEKQLEQCHYALAVLKQAMAWEEQNFGLAYDLDIYHIVAINDLNVGAMENKGLNVFNSNLLLASATTTTDADFNKIAAVIAHEYFHNWTGNRVTCRDWFQIGLKEGLTTLREQLFMEDTYGYVINRINAIKIICTKQFAEDASPLLHPIRLQSYIDVNNFYTVTIYHKSAEVARMLYTIFGKKIFQKIIQTFLCEYDGQAVTIEDFLDTAATVTKTNLEQFKLWYDQAGTPNLEVTDSFTSKGYTLKITQNHPHANRDFYIPIVMAMVYPDGVNTATRTLISKTREQFFSFPHCTAKPIPSLLRDFSAPVKIIYKYNDDALLLLLSHDQNPINAWDACHLLMLKIIQQLSNDFAANQQLTLPPILIHAFKTVLNNSNITAELIAQMLQLPTENYLLTNLQIDIDTIHYVSEFLKLELAKNLKTVMLACYKHNHDTKPYQLDADSIGKRSLKNLALHYLMYLNTVDIYHLCLQQLEHANNMTDIQASLTALANSNYPKREQVLASYYQKWRDQPNLVNKWLAINATIKTPGTLQRVQKLIYHPAFNPKNPNNVYALIRTFSENNPNNFHEKSGSGYKFLADQVLAIDKFNPQLAAAIVLPLTRGHKLDNARQKLLQLQLTRISQETQLSKNVYEIINKVEHSI